MTESSYRAVCFDLDGTLLPQDIDEFLSGYFGALGAKMVAEGVPADAFKYALGAGTKAMAAHNDTKTNEQVYWETFRATLNKVAGNEIFPMDKWMALFTDFYENEFGSIGDKVNPDQNMVDAVAELKAKGYPLMLTTMPLFPPQAVAWRLKWAGLEEGQFERITHYENSTAAKPSLRYYAENLAAMDIAGSDILMVGNNTVEDLAFTKLGADAFIVTNHLLDPIGFDLSQIKHGDSQAFLEWVRQLPACENPLQGVNTGLVDPALTDAAFEANKVADLGHDDYVPIGMEHLD